MNPQPSTLQVTVIGAGTMGHGIAQVAAAAGLKVLLVDQDAAALARGRKRIDENLAGGIQRGKLTEADRDRTVANLATTTSLAEAARASDLFIEAIVEQLEPKQALFRQIESLAPGHAILASNTSSLPLTKIAAALSDPSRLIGMHFFNPVFVMKLIEIVVHPKTGARARELALDVSQRMGKTPIVVKDSPGFASSRLGVILGLEAMRMVEQGVASPREGAVGFVARFGSTLDLKLHFHALVLDGVYRGVPGKLAPQFHAAPPLAASPTASRRALGSAAILPGPETHCSTAGRSARELKSSQNRPEASIAPR